MNTECKTLKPVEDTGFQPINRAYNTVFRPNRLSLGLVVPIETYAKGPVPTLERHLERVQLAEALGFAAVWLRDVPFNVPSFGDAGQTYDPFVYLGLLAGQTQRIALGVASIILPLRHPAHVAKAAATIDVMSGGRLILGVASGDRPEEYPALNRSFSDRGATFRESFDYIRQMGQASPTFDNAFGHLTGGMDMLPKPTSGKLPLLITGGSQQAPDWIAQNGDGWMTYPRDTVMQARVIRDWQARVEAIGGANKPIMQPLYIDLTEDPDTRPQPIHLGFRLGVNHLRAYLKSLEQIGMNHVALNLRFNQADIETTLKRLADDILPEFTVCSD
ncbi:LLM class oxidoreductase [Acaryochloris marina]|uniref:Luciferase-like monooxygenase n=1 Tax=Acaryochloris marina (strain MBIC 11017) TaxID=329726 RepID=B0CA58_ACAM1|nr:LLM class oxidoreductase [Acaryochloris marina]ABW26645.1 luciferase-like monooxygenase [Acaryochloris marina MBIC11017]BDM81434.1 N5,N10-methylene tetrahydromethanopterin reductase [Acaryochloris marina MBIC10699]